MSTERHFDADVARGLHKPVSFTFGKKKYTVKPITQAVMKQNLDLAKDTEDPFDVLIGQIHVLTGGAKDDFKDIDLETLRDIMHHITSSMLDPLGKPEGEPKT